jgi:GntR family transcriptional regulator/MocR family aminotransferase
LRDALSGFIDLAAGGPDPLHLQIARQIKTAVLSGKLPPQSRIPSSRMLASELGISRNTVVTALDQLKAEGYLDSFPGSALRVADMRAPDLARAESAGSKPPQFAHRLARRWQKAIADHPAPPMEAPAPFRAGIPDTDLFPHEVWGRMLRRASRRISRGMAGYAHISGVPRFREILCQHLVEARGVVAEPEQIIVTSSARGGLSLIAEALLEPGEDVWVEEPGFRSAKAVFSAGEARICPVPVDAGGLGVAGAPQGSVPRLIYTTPSHQFPTGVLMSLGRRLELLDFASRHNAYVIEDDYDSEFQFTGRPIASLQGLDRMGCVLYLGTFAKSLLPSLRVGFVVAPPELVDGLVRVHRQTGQFVPPVIQLALADFIDSGDYRAHVRRARGIYAERLAAFGEGIARHSGGQLMAAPRDGGLQTVVTPAGPLSDEALAGKLAQAGIQCQPLSELHLAPDAARHKGVLMGFAAWGQDEADRAFRKLAALYGQGRR